MNSGTRTEGNSSDYEMLLRFHRETAALEQLGELAGWDQETFMPPQAVEQRSEQISALTRVIHNRMVSNEFGDLIAAAGGTGSDQVAGANLRLLRVRRRRAMAVPADLAVAIARETVMAVSAWQQARKSEDSSVFLPNLKTIIRLKREEASHLAEGGDKYAALLSVFEPGIPSDWLDGLFRRLHDRLKHLRDAAIDTGARTPELSARFQRSRQLELARIIAGSFGYDWNRGRLDQSAHPFTSGSCDDVRITTRVDESDPYNCLYSTIHETGHGIYEQNILKDYAFMPVAGGASFGVHESQSRFFENQVARSRAYCSWLYRKLGATFGEFGIEDERQFFAHVNRLQRGHIRTESDEIQYNLHIMLRYDLERKLIAGELEVNDLEEAWNSQFAADFGFAVDSPSHGMLQDIHWAAGLIGYFPTYTLGNIYSGCLHDALRRDIPDLDDYLRQGDPMPAVEWMKTNIQQYGAVFQPLKLIRRATGGEVSELPLIKYLEEKFSDLHGVGLALQAS